MTLRSWLSKLLATGQDGLAGLGARTTGPPTSSNAASSFHLTWEAPPVPLVEVAATIEVLEPPTVPMLYFWALQVSFVDGGVRRGGAHLGLQYHPSYPDGGAVNWGGYHDGGGELDGSISDLPSALDNPNTRTYPWHTGRRYRHRVFRSPERGWRATMTDLDTGQETVVRDLWVAGDGLINPMVWSEVFAHCDHPSVAVRWSGLTGRTADGESFEARAVRLNYQTHGDGGCANTDTSIDDVGFVQRTAVERRHPTGTRLVLGRG